MKLCIRFYTGTGNTARAASVASGEFAAAGWTVDARPVTRGMDDPYSGLSGCDLLVVAFSALGFSASATMAAWLKAIPRRVGGKSAVLCVCGSEIAKGAYSPGWGGDAMFSAARILAGRGWSVSGVAEASYPVNWTEMTNPPEERHLAGLLAKGDAASRQFAAALAAGGVPTFVVETAGRKAARIVAFLFRLLGRRALGALFVSDESCTSCGLCARSCPAAAIAMRGGLPAWTGRCDSCNRCINICPTRSIRTSSLLLSAHVGIGLFLAAFAFAVPLPASLQAGARAAARAVFLLLGPALQFGLLAPMLSSLARARPFRKPFAVSFMKDYRRYREPGFRP